MTFTKLMDNPPKPKSAANTTSTIRAPNEENIEANTIDLL
ncbi:hypothetical protein HPSA20_0122 [Helicobacter pylori SouthAfrica20]|uniref:Uncharacterized protein n=1 Tax=Helicobacter pylori SouthAfrica20 TaxID=1352356 RepID=T1U7N3_HELPX|nr:hypothetical protein HPSA20_0122 [Helicobacter pylori SouthAfrica20]